MNAQAKSKNDLYKISDLARETGTSQHTIKYYMREGVLPPPTLKTGRNMAYYDESFIGKIRCIRELSEKRHLPLNVIKAIIDRDDSVISAGEISTLLGIEGTFYEAIHYAPGHIPITREEAQNRYGLDDEYMDYLIETGILTPVDREGVELFEGDDILLLDNLAQMTKAGYDDDFIPHKLSTPVYFEALDKLAREELKMFSRAVTGKDVGDARIAEMALAGMKLAEQFIVLLRRKLILRAIQQLREESEKA